MQGLLTIFAAATSPPGRVGDDGAVIQRIAKGEDPALAELYDRYAQILYTLGMRILRSVQDAEDIVQEVFRTIRRLKEEGITLLLVEQFAKSALEVADYAYVMERGHIAVEGTPEELGRNERVIAAYLG